MNLPECKMGPWENVGSCSKSCGGGFQLQERVCDGNYCGSQDTMQTISCMTEKCPVCPGIEGNFLRYNEDSNELVTYYEGRETRHGCHKGECWAYCGASWTSGDWCYTKAWNHGGRQKCDDVGDCICSYQKCDGYCNTLG